MFPGHCKKKKIAMLVFVCFVVVFFFLLEVGNGRDCVFCRAGQRLTEWTMPVVMQVRRE